VLNLVLRGQLYALTKFCLRHEGANTVICVAALRIELGYDVNVSRYVAIVEIEPLVDTKATHELDYLYWNSLYTTHELIGVLDEEKVGLIPGYSAIL